jgi:hypothetical protein
MVATLPFEVVFILDGLCLTTHCRSAAGFRSNDPKGIPPPSGELDVNEVRLLGQITISNGSAATIKQLQTGA